MKVCTLIICQLLAGGGPRECDRAVPITYAELREVTTHAECAKQARRVWNGEIPIPAGLRLQRVEMMVPETQEAKR